MITQNKKAFTLVELIIVITILAILATIGFISYQSYTQDSRDSARKRDLTQLSKGLEIYQTKNSILPDPDQQTVTIMSGGLIISIQGYAGTSVLQKIKATEMKDSSDNNYYTYSVNGDKTKYQLLSLLEANTVARNNVLNESYAVDYTARYPYTKGNKVGIFFSGTTNTPIQETTSGNLVLTDATNSTKLFKVIFSNDKTNSGTITSTGANLPATIQAITNTVATTSSTTITGPTCPSGFIYIPGSANIDGQVKGWCVAKYEMSPYSSAGWLQDSTYGGFKYTADTSTTLNSSPGLVTSKSGSYPITYISRNEAESTCETKLVDNSSNSIANGKLLTLQLWKKLADDIYNQGINWSSGYVGSTYISRGHANSGKNNAGTADAFSWSSTCFGSAGTRYICPTMTDPTITSPTDYYSNRAYKLSSGDVIHDFAGNVWEWYYNTHNGIVDGNWRDYTYAANMGVLGFVIDFDTNSTLLGAGIIDATSAGLGQIYNFGAVSGTTYAGNYGAAFSNVGYSGIFSSNWTSNTVSSTRSGAVGFRCIAPAN